MKKTKKDIAQSDKKEVDINVQAINAYYKNLTDSHNRLLQNIKKNMPELEEMFKKCSDHWHYEDAIYRYYHGSFKVYYIQSTTNEIVELLKKISPHEDKDRLNNMFLNILEKGASNMAFDYKHNKVWEKTCRPFVEAFFHAKFFLEMAIKYGKELEEAPNMLPSGYAALLYLYNLR